MFGYFRNVDEELIASQTRQVLNSMDNYTPDSPEYPELLGHLERLMKMKADARRRLVISDQSALVIGNLLGILVIVAYEQKHAMVSKALPFVMKPKT